MQPPRGISIQLAPADDEPGPVELRVQPNGSVRAGPHELDQGSDTRVVNGWSVRVRGPEEPLTWSGPELLIFASASTEGGRMRCPLPTDEGKVVVLGRSRRACDVVVPDEHVSRVHLRITAHAGGHTVEDSQSRWGTQINGRKLVEPHTLAHGDEIRLGTSTIRYVTRWDEAAFQPVGVARSELPEHTMGGETLAMPSDFIVEHVERPRSRTNIPAPVARQTVPPLWIGIGIGITMALIAMIIWTMVTWLWPSV